jgi:hypothetical protein
MCCASREPAQSFEQYIDTGPGTGNYTPVTLEQHWNSEHMKSVRQRMMAGETLPECDVCNNKLLNTDVYRSYFNQLFGHKYAEAMSATASNGSTTLKPISWDYRFSNLCNFKCRTCGDMLSSSWESEQRSHNMIDWTNTKNNWMIPEVRKKITKFQDNQIELEFSQAVEEHRVQEVYWVGGEPLMYEQHWRYMQRIVELGDGQNVYARYNTNLSRIDYRGINLFSDILINLRDWQICASLDGTGKVGEYIRTGLDYQMFVENFKKGIKHSRNSRNMRLDFTLTLPGMFEVENMETLARELQVNLLAKVIFSFSPDIIMSPLALPRTLLDPWIDELASQTSGAMHDVLMQLKNRPTFQEQYTSEEYQTELSRGKKRIQQLEKIRKDHYTLRDILSQKHNILEWYDSIS